MSNSMSGWMASTELSGTGLRRSDTSKVFSSTGACNVPCSAPCVPKQAYSGTIEIRTAAAIRAVRGPPAETLLPRLPYP